MRLGLLTGALWAVLAGTAVATDINTACPHKNAAGHAYVSTPAGPHGTHVWYDPDAGATVATRADTLHQQLETVIWPKITPALNATPIPDGNGPDAGLDVCLEPTVTKGSEQLLGATRPLGAADHQPSIVMIPLEFDSQALDDSDLHNSLAHEFTHVLEHTLHAAEDQAWWADAVCQWGVELAYHGENFEQSSKFGDWLGEYFKTLIGTPLAIDSLDNSLARYGAYVLPWYLAKTQGASIVRHIYDAAPGRTPVAQALNAALGSGGLRRIWPLFMEQNWVAKPWNKYVGWDNFTKGVNKTVTPEQPPINTSRPLTNTALPHLSGLFHDVEIPAGVHTVAYLNTPPYGGGDPSEVLPDAQLNLLADDAGTGTPYKLTNKPGWVDCESATGDSIDQMVLSYSNSNPTQDLVTGSDGDPTIFATNVGCGAWTGNVNGSAKRHYSYGTLTETTTASNVTFALPAPSSHTPDQLYDVTGGNAVWKLTGRLGDCTYSGKDSYSLAGKGTLQLGWNSDPTSPTGYSGQLGSVVPGKQVQVTVTCSGESHKESYQEIAPWLSAEDNNFNRKVGADGATIASKEDGREPTSYGYRTFHYDWSLLTTP